MRPIPMVFVAVVVLIVLSPADASGERDVLLPDEYGLAVFVVPAVQDADRGLPTLSWQAFRVNDWGVYATVLRPYYRPGFGLDAGILERKVRFGAGYVDAEIWGVYLRRSF